MVTTEQESREVGELGRKLILKDRVLRSLFSINHRGTPERRGEKGRGRERRGRHMLSFLG
jgi:hypothetical protein